MWLESLGLLDLDSWLCAPALTTIIVLVHQKGRSLGQFQRHLLSWSYVHFFFCCNGWKNPLELLHMGGWLLKLVNHIVKMNCQHHCYMTLYKGESKYKFGPIYLCKFIKEHDTTIFSRKSTSLGDRWYKFNSQMFCLIAQETYLVRWILVSS